MYLARRPSGPTMTLLCWVLLVTGESLNPASVDAGTGPPDGFGYTWIDSNDGCDPDFPSFGLNAVRELGATTLAGPYDLGFVMPYYGEPVTQVWVHPDGYALLSADIDGPRGPLPDAAAPNHLIAANWGETNFSDLTVEARPNSFLIRWVQDLVAGWTRTSQLLLNSDGSLQMRWGGAEFSMVTIGHEDASATNGRTLFHDGMREPGFVGPVPGESVCILPPLLLDCGAAVPVTCGDSLATNLPLASARQATTYACTALPYPGNEALFRLDLLAPQAVSVAIDSPDLDLLWIDSNPCGEPWCLGLADDRFDFSILLPGTYYFAVDKQTPGGGDAFTLDVSCSAPYEVVTCSSVTPGTTMGTSILDRHSCAGPLFDGPESLYTLNLAADQTLTAWLDGAPAGLWVMIYELAAFESGTPPSCLAAGPGGATVLDAPAGDYVIVVDGEGGVSGDYMLEVRCGTQLDCAAARELSCGELVSGDTTGAPAAVGIYTCASEALPDGEDVYHFLNPVEQAVTFELVSGQPGQQVILLKSCDEGDCFLAGEDGLSCGFVPPGEYFVIVDGPPGPYELQVSCGDVVAGADLLVTALDASQLMNDCLNFSVVGNVLVQVSNVGADDAPGPIEVYVYEDRNTSGAYEPGPDILLGRATENAGVPSGRTLAVSVPSAGTLLFRDNAIHAHVDAFDAIMEPDEDNNTLNTGQACSIIPDFGVFDLIEEWSWRSPPVHSAHDHVDTNPLVADMNGDGRPEILFAASDSPAYGNGFVRCISGQDGTELWVADGIQSAIFASTNIALADLDDDGRPEVVALSAIRTDRLVFLDDDGSYMYMSEPFQDHPDLDCDRVPKVCGGGAPAIADLDCDGSPEIIYGANVFRADGSYYWNLPPGRTRTQGINHGIRSPPLDSAISVAVDVDLDGTLEVVAGPTAYTFNEVTGEADVLWTNNLLRDGFVAVGNFDGDDFPEIVLTSNGQVHLLEGETGELIWTADIPLGGGGCNASAVDGGPPTVADFDGDCLSEIGVAGADWYAVFETDGTLRWKSPINDCSSHRTASTVFDFDGDGAAEVAFADENWLFIFSGIDGSEFARFPTSSHTWQEMVTIADVDADGSAEIVVPMNGSRRGIAVIGDADGKWVSTRGIWNQHSYHIDHINDDGSIPGPLTGGCESPSWLGHATYRDQLGESVRLAADLTFAIVSTDFVEVGCDREITLEVLIGNGGAVPVGSSSSCAFYSREGVEPPQLLLLETIPDLAPGEFTTLTTTLVLPYSPNLVILGVVDDDGTGMGSVVECREDNNDCVVVITDPGPPLDPPFPVGPTLRAEGHGDPYAANITGSFEWRLDEGLPRPVTDHYHVHRSLDPRALFLVTDIERHSDTAWTDSTPRAVDSGTVHYYKIFAANNCEILEQ